MSVSNSILVEEKIFSRLQVKETLLLLSLSVLLPFLVHLLPELKGIPMGAILLAMFFAPLIAVRFYKLHVGLLIAFFSPLINFSITGNPKAILLPIMIIQLVVFVAGLNLLGKFKSTLPVSSLIAYIFCIAVSFVLLLVVPSILPGTLPGLFLLTSLLNALPGVALLIAVDFTIKKFQKD